MNGKTLKIALMATVTFAAIGVVGLFLTENLWFDLLVVPFFIFICWYIYLIEKTEGSWWRE